MKTLQKFFFIFLAILFITNITLAAEVDVTSDNADTIYYKSNGKTNAISLDVTINDTKLMGYQFDILWDPALLQMDTTNLAAGGFLSDSLTAGVDTYFLNIVVDNTNGSATIAGVRMVDESAGNSKGLSGLVTLLTSIEFDTAAGATDTDIQAGTVAVTNFVFRDQYNNTILASNAIVSFDLLKRLLAADFSGPGEDGIPFTDDDAPDDYVDDVDLLLFLSAWHKKPTVDGTQFSPMDLSGPGLDGIPFTDDDAPDDYVDDVDLLVFLSYWHKHSSDL